MKLKKRIVSLAVVAAMLSIAAMGTLAYFVDEATAHNVITTAAIDITLNDKTVIDDVIVDFPSFEEGGIGGVMPGTSVSKIVSVTNDGASAAWVRIRLEQYIMDATADNLLPMELADGTPAFTLNYTEDTPWVQGPDGHWYYPQQLAAAATTETLFESVSFAPGLGNEYQRCTAHVIVIAEAVQTVNNPMPASGNPWDIPGWPEASAEE